MTPAASSSGCASAVWAITFRCAKASCTHATAHASLSSAAQPSAEATTATVSNSTDGAPASWKSPISALPSSSFTPPRRGATILTDAPTALTPAINAPTSFEDAPSVTNIPTSRPTSVGGPFARMLSFGDGSRSVRVATAATAGTIGAPWFRPVATRSPSVVSMLTR